MQTGLGWLAKELGGMFGRAGRGMHIGGEGLPFERTEFLETEEVSAIPGSVDTPGMNETKAKLAAAGIGFERALYDTLMSRARESGKQAIPGVTAGDLLNCASFSAVTINGFRKTTTGYLMEDGEIERREN